MTARKRPARRKGADQREYRDTLEDGREVVWKWSEGPTPRREPVRAWRAKTLHVEVTAAGKVRTVRRALVEQLDPLDWLRGRVVHDDPQVCAAGDLVATTHRVMLAALKRAAESPELSAAHRVAVKAWEAAQRKLRAAVAERLAHPPDLGRLFRILGVKEPAALATVLRRFPQAVWPYLWTARDEAGLLRAVLYRETRQLELKREREDAIGPDEVRAMTDARKEWRLRSRDCAQARQAFGRTLTGAELTDRQSAYIRAKLGDGAPLEKPFTTRERVLLYKKLAKGGQM